MPARGPSLCGFLVALEAFRRGLSVTWHADTEQLPLRVIGGRRNPLVGELFSVSDGKKTVHFQRTRSEECAAAAMAVCSDKLDSKRTLEARGIRVPRGRVVDDAGWQASVEALLRETGWPLVVKPVTGSQGRGVSTGLNSIEDVAGAIDRIRRSDRPGPILVEEHVSGQENRVFVVGDRVAGAFRRVPAHVVANGRSSIRALVAAKNRLRKQSPHLSTKPIKLDEAVTERLTRLGMSLDSVPERGETIYLNTISNLSRGGESVDVTDSLPESAKWEAVRAVQAVEGLNVAGVDVLLSGDDEVSLRPYVVEINTTAQIGAHLFPMNGKARDVPSAIIEHHFPRTRRSHALVFDYAGVVGDLEAGRHSSVSLPAVSLAEPCRLDTTIRWRKLTPTRKRRVIAAMRRSRLHGSYGFAEGPEAHLSLVGDRQDLERFLERLPSHGIQVAETRWIPWGRDSVASAGLRELDFARLDG